MDVPSMQREANEHEEEKAGEKNNISDGDNNKKHWETTASGTIYYEMLNSSALNLLTDGDYFNIN
jgi:hypothetical protein